MTRITIEVTRPEDQRLVEDLLNRLGIPNRAEEISPNGKSVVRLMQELAERQSFNDIEDPVAWQREVRQDRSLPLRD
jgi:hypothetical protein